MLAGLSAERADIFTISGLLDKSTRFLKSKDSATARLDAELLLAEVLGVSRVELYTNFEQPLNSAEIDHYRELVLRRGKGEPVAYILGRAYFRNLTLRVDGSVLIPRPETENVVEEALKHLREGRWEDRPADVLDVGTGCGAIAISIAAEFPKASVTAVDSSEAALELARENARTSGVAPRIDFVLSDLLGGLDPAQPFDLIVSNPPYISANEWPTLPVDVREYEPRRALYGGADGLDVYRRLAAETPQFLYAGGCLILEIGHTQGLAVMELLGGTGFYVSIDVKKDYAGHDRIVEALRNNK